MGKKCKCLTCGRDGTTHEFHPVAHTTGTRYICEYCARRVDRYTDENTSERGHDKNGLTFSCEFEIPSEFGIAFPDDYLTRAQYLLAQGFESTYDCTVWREYKSPIYHGLQSFSRVAAQIDKILQPERWNTSGVYGTHCNIGRIGYGGDDVTILRTWYSTLTRRLYATINADRDACGRIYGRTESMWAQTNPEACPTEHALFINLQHTTHIEFRLSKYINSRQYMECVKTNADIAGAMFDFVATVKQNCRRFSGAALIAENRKAAEKASRKIDNEYRKHAGLPRVNKTA